MVVVPSLAPSLLYGDDVDSTLPVVRAAPSTLPFLETQESRVIVTNAPGQGNRVLSFLDAMLNCKLSKNQIKEKHARLKKTATLESLVMTRQERIDNSYPPVIDTPTLSKHKLGVTVEGEVEEPSRKKVRKEGGIEQPINCREQVEESSIADEEKLRELGYVFTDDSVLKKAPYAVAIDCEMVLTTVTECARVSIVDYEGTVIYDHYVRPEGEVTDFRTQFSGITPELIDNATKTLVDVQTDILELISKETFIIGHSLENDLHCLKVNIPLTIHAVACS